MSRKVNIGLVQVESDLDVTAVPAVRRQIDQLISSGCRCVYLNMACVSHVDSAGMGLIVTELRRMRRMGGLLSLLDVSSQVYRALRRMRMLDLMPVKRSGSKSVVAALDPSALPSWRTTFRVDAEGLADARERVEQLLDTLPFSQDEIFDMTLASGEALGNAVDHTCGSGVIATVTAYPDRVIVDVADCGDGFDLADDEEPPETGPCAERGRGIRLMRLLADSVTISHKSAGEGTLVRLVKLFDTMRAAVPTTPSSAV